MELDEQLKKILSGYSHAVQSAVDSAVTSVSKEAVKELKQAGGYRNRRKTRNYRKSFRTKRVDKDLHLKNIVYSTQHQLTHLLEHGHAVSGAASRSMPTRAFPHWAVAEDYVKRELKDEIVKEISNIKV